MKILYLYQYFSTPKGAWGTRVYGFAKEWVNKGHEVTVVTSIYSKSDLTASGFVERKKIDGINVIVLNIKIDNKQNPFKRICSFIWYCLASSFYALTEKYDIVIASSGPITVGVPGLLANLLRRKKLVFEVRDLWPETAIQLGFVRSGILKKMMYFFEKKCYARSCLVITLSPGMKEDILKRYNSVNVVAVENSANVGLFSKRIKGSYNFPFKRKRYAVYTGNIGKTNNSELLLKVARLLFERKIDVKIIIAGDGKDKRVLQSEAARLGLSNQFVILNLMPKDELVPLIQNSLASLVPLANMEVLDTSSPNKLFESFAAGIPVIQTTKGWIKDMLEEKKCGLSVSPVDPNEMVDALKYLLENDELWEVMSKNASQLAKNEYSTEVLSKKMITSIEKVF